jgi:signal peptidase
MTDKKIIRIFSASTLFVLLLALFLPLGESGRIIAAILLPPAAVLSFIFIKKRNIPSINKNQVLLIVIAAAAIYVMAYYLTGFEFGFLKNAYRVTAGTNFFKFFLPISVIIVATEVFRYVMMAQKDRFAHVTCYLSCVIAEMLICSNIPYVTSFNRFIDLIAGALFPAIISNFFYNYLAKRYGIYPNIAFRAIITLHAYVFPVSSGISESLVNLFDLFLPIVLFLFIDALFERKRKYALKRTPPALRVASALLTTVVVVIMIGTVMLVSNQFKYGALVIATESMTGEINKGDIIIFESYEDQPIEEGRVIVFDKDDTMVVHRVVDIEIINGVARYYTKGDANDDNDAGFITEGDIVGVTDYKLPSIGYPVLWMRSLFNR